MSEGDILISQCINVLIEPIRYYNGTKNDILTTLKRVDVGFAGTAPQLYAISPNWFDDSYLLSKEDVCLQDLVLSVFQLASTFCAFFL